VAALSTSEDRHWLAIDEISAAGAARRAAVALGEEAGLSATGLGDLAIVATEMATNLARHAIDGAMLLRLRRVRDAVGVELLSIDRGPGMPDVAESLRDGHSTAGTLGIGLGAVARKASDVDLYSLPGAGTVLAATVWAGRNGGRPPPPAWVAGVSRPIADETMCGDAYVAREIDGRRQVLLCDGLGHGALAALAAQAIQVEFTTAPALDPLELLGHLHRRVRHTRGVVVGVAELDEDGVRYCGIGNITATIVDGGRRRAMVSLPGIVGQQYREAREFVHPTGSGTLVVLHSDGLTDKWDLGQYPGLTEHTPVVIAGTLLRDAARRHDDAAILVARTP
jgi:anti-sigma regulatory factor (Ser/Thr protein kinase)